jgi:hypothetical protein
MGTIQDFLELHPDKTRLIPFGRKTDWIWCHRGGPKPFNFLGFTHSCAKTADVLAAIWRSGFAIMCRPERRTTPESAERLEGGAPSGIEDGRYRRVAVNATAQDWFPQPPLQLPPGPQVAHVVRIPEPVALLQSALGVKEKVRVWSQLLVPPVSVPTKRSTPFV